MNLESGSMDIIGGGTGELHKGFLTYTVGDNRGRSEIVIQDNTLTLSPDPVELDRGFHAITVYGRVIEM